MLREGLARFLPAYAVAAGHSDGAVRPLVSDREILDLLLNLEVFWGNDVTRAQQLYEDAIQTQPAASSPRQGGTGLLSDDAPTQSAPESGLASADNSNGDTLGSAQQVSTDEPDTDGAPDSQPSPGLQATSPSLEGHFPPPSFDELINRGWIRVAWGRVHLPDDIRFTILRNRDTIGTPLRQLIDELHGVVFRIRDGFNPTGHLCDIANSLIHGEIQPEKITCISRAWIAARLWDTESGTLSGQSAEQRMRRWVDRWRMLNWPQFAMSNQLEPASLEEFHKTALDVLSAPSTTPGWEEFRIAASVPVAILHPDWATIVESIVSIVPATAVDRMRWLAHGRPEKTYHEYMAAGGSSLMVVLLNDLVGAPLDRLALGSRLMGIAVERPVLLQELVLGAQRTPALLADMLMSPSTCTVACAVIANWRLDVGGWNRAFQAPANRAMELFAFEDAVAILGGHLDARQLQVRELAALYLYIYELSANPRQPTNRLAMLSLLREELAASSDGVQDSVVVDLIATARSASNPMTAFCAALDLASEGGCADRIDPSELVSAYIDVVMPRGGELAPRMLEREIAQLLVSSALRCNEPLRNGFLRAVDMHAWLGLAPTEEREQYSHYDLLKRRVRLHIRVLCRAIAVWPDEIPAELIDALARSVRAGTADRPERETLDAFALGFVGPAAPPEEPIALDLAAALRRMQGGAAQPLVTAYCQIEEPAVLAGIVANTPGTLNAAILAHLEHLTPSTSSDAWSLVALQARVEALLSANLPDIAQTFIDAERNATTLGPVPGREIAQLRATLRVLLLRKDWPTIASYQLPDDMRDPVRREASDALIFYQAIAHLQNPGGDPAAAEAIFADLSNRHRAINPYRVNLFASRVGRLLHGDALKLLSGDNLSEAKRYLAEAERNTRPLIQHSPSDLKPLDMNRAILLLAVNEPRKALQVLLELREIRYDTDIECFRALAMARLGNKREALAVLEQVRRVFSVSDLLTAVRENIDSHRPYATVPSLALSDDPVPGIRHVFEAFARLGHVEQAEVLQSQGRMDLYLLEQVREACAGLVAIAPMMRDLGVAREDDISAVLKQILRSSLRFPQWTVEDQSRGGYSGSGGVGERDIVISKGSVTLAILEALVVDSVETVNLTAHFRKLLGYDTCLYFFHVTYARGANCARILEHLRQACQTPPIGFTYSQSENLTDLDSMPRGFQVYYKADSRDVVVSFLVLDIGQATQRGAARKSGA